MNLPFNIDLKNKVVVITGGGGVICSSFAKALSKTGAKVAILDINEHAAKTIAQELCTDNSNVIGVKCDVLDTKSIKDAHNIILDTFGKCDILINGAGGNHPKATTTNEVFNPNSDSTEITFFDLTKEAFEFVFDLNFMGTFLPTQEFAKDMINNTSSTIINISSMNAFRPLTKIPAYSTAKSAISNFTQWLAVHFAPVGIRVNAIAPGFLSTTQTKHLFFNEDGTETKRYSKIIDHTPMKRLGKPDDLIGTLFWLISYEASSFVTGTVIPVDGGFSAYSGV